MFEPIFFANEGVLLKLKKKNFNICFQTLYDTGTRHFIYYKSEFITNFNLRCEYCRKNNHRREENKRNVRQGGVVQCP